jgi:hypothetical protein
MDMSAIIVILVLTALSIGAIVWMERNSRRMAKESAANAERGRPVSGNETTER